MRVRWAAFTVVVAVMFAIGTASASARTEMVTSFDGTQIKVNFFPTDAVAPGVDVEIAGKRKDRQIVGVPHLSIDYSGNATDPDARVFAQLVDDDTGTVLGNQVTPIPLRLDGERHTVRRPLEAVAHTLRPGSGVTLQITASATNYGPQRATGLANLRDVDIKLPVVKARSAG